MQNKKTDVFTSVFWRYHPESNWGSGSCSPTPYRLAMVPCGAADEARTRYLHLGKVALYQMSYSRIFLSSRFWLTASKQDLLYQVMCPLSTLFFLFSQIFPKYRKPTAHTVGFLFSFSASQCTQTSSCSPRRGRLSRCLIASCAGMPPYSTAYIASVIGMDTPCCCAR